MIKPNKAFWLIAFAAMIGLTLPTLIQDGMFMDAMLYTSVSHNLSMGIGTFWFPEFSVHNVGGLSSFHEQPPLVFGIQSLFYTVLGDSMYVERFYTFLTMVITAFLINLVWK
jgi:4-amino-4-deoxy-L-arabinose transferase-like glycosyltransferase